MIGSTRSTAPLPSSFRDPSGYVYESEGILYRFIHPDYLKHYQLLQSSGLYKVLTGEQKLIVHEEVSSSQSQTEGLTIRPEKIPWISYPYEWTFGQLQAAALLTLDIQKKSLEHGMTLKDASAFNVQWIGYQPIFIDTLSFEKYIPGSPWLAYRQFCEHFLAPLALMTYTDLRSNQFLKVHLDGIPLEVATQLLPVKAWFNTHLLCHIKWHSEAKTGAEKKSAPARHSPTLNLTAMYGLLDHLRSSILSLKIKPRNHALWSDYYDQTCSYSETSLAHKKELAGLFLAQTNAKIVWDLGANTGLFSRIASDQGAYTVAMDLDPECAEACFRQTQTLKDKKLLPLVMDLSNPSPSLGWAHEERSSLSKRGPADAILALALVHHLAISHNLPLDRIAEYFVELGKWLIIEFVPKSDPQTQKLLSGRADIFSHYTKSDFETQFSKHFDIVDAETISGTERRLYRMRRLHD